MSRFLGDAINKNRGNLYELREVVKNQRRTIEIDFVLIVPKTNEKERSLEKEKVGAIAQNSDKGDG